MPNKQLPRSKREHIVELSKKHTSIGYIAKTAKVSRPTAKKYMVKREK